MLKESHPPTHKQSVDRQMATTAASQAGAPAEAAAVKKAMDIKSTLAAAVPSAVRKLPLVLQQAREHALLGHYDKALELHARALKEV